MNNIVDIKTWADKNIPQPLAIRPPLFAKGLQKGAKITLIVIFGGLIALLLSGVIEKIVKYNIVNWNMIIILTVFTALVVWFFIFIDKKKKAIITGIDKNGITTQGGTQHQWTDIKKIRIHKAMKRYSISQLEYFVEFKFTTGTASASSYSPDFRTIQLLVEQIPVEKSGTIDMKYN